MCMKQYWDDECLPRFSILLWWKRARNIFLAEPWRVEGASNRMNGSSSTATFYHPICLRYIRTRRLPYFLTHTWHTIIIRSIHVILNRTGYCGRTADSPYLARSQNNPFRDFKAKQSVCKLDPFTAGNPLLGTKLLGFSMGRGSGALKRITIVTAL